MILTPGNQLVCGGIPSNLNVASQQSFAGNYGVLTQTPTGTCPPSPPPPPVASPPPAVITPSSKSSLGGGAIAGGCRANEPSYGYPSMTVLAADAPAVPPLNRLQEGQHTSVTARVCLKACHVRAQSDSPPWSTCLCSRSMHSLQNSLCL